MEIAHTTEGISRQRKRRRWLIRLTLLLALMIIISIIVIMMLLQPTGLTINQAKELADRIMSPGEHTRSEYEQLLGKPHSVRDMQNGYEAVWNFNEHYWNEVRSFGYIIRFFPDGVMMDVKTYEGGTVNWRAAWMLRWELLKHRLGLRQQSPLAFQ